MMNTKICNTSMLKNIIVFTLVAFAMTANAYGQEANERTVKIRRDIDIMEGVLNKLIFEDNRESSFGNNTTGTYLEGYGVIFNIAYGNLGRHIMVETVKDDEKKERNKEETVQVLFGGYSSSKDPEETIKILKDNICIFFSDYAGAMKDLVTDERITVTVDFNGSRDAFWLYASDNESSRINRLIATAKQGDISAVSKGSLQRDQFEKKVVFEEEIDDSGDNKDFWILADIFDTALKRHRRWQTLSFSGKSRSMYFPGFGAVFMTNAIFPSDNYEVIAQAFAGRILDDKVSTLTNEIGKGEEKRSDKELIQELQDDIIDILGRYGATLRSVPEDEYVLITVDISNPFESQLPTKMLIKSKMSDIKLFNREQMSFDKFKNIIQIKQY